ncbi:conjugated polyketone reductase C1 [Meredithblackwellia eburnea MCA 4105]
MIPVPSYTLLDGRQLPILQWGTGSGESKPQALRAGTFVLKSGLRAIDTASGYNTEGETGQAWRDSGLDRSEVFIASKISQKDCQTAHGPLPLDSIREAVLSTIERLGTQPDLLLVHNPFVAAPGQMPAVWKILEEMKDSGELTSSIGVSNFRPSQDLEELLAVAKYKPTVNQMEFHPLVLSHIEPLLKLQAEHGIITTAYGPLSPILRHPSKGGPLKPVLERIAQRLGNGFDSSHVILLWIRAMGVGLITTSANEERIKKFADLQTLLKDQLGTLTREEVDEITRIGKEVYFRFYSEHMEVDHPIPNLPVDWK